MTVRTFSMSAGLAASTVTPGSTPPETSRTTPAMLPVPAVCAPSAAGRRTSPAIRTTTPLKARHCVLVIIVNLGLIEV